MRAAAAAFLILVAGCSYESVADDARAACDSGVTSELEACLADQLAELEDQRVGLVDRLAAEPEPGAGEGWREAGAAFESYRDATCEAVGLHWVGGTIRGAVAIGCRIGVTEAEVDHLRAAFDDLRP